MANIDNIEFLKRMSRHSFLLDHDIEECGMCYYNYISAQIAIEMLERNETTDDLIKKWSDELEKRWHESKYYKLWIEEIKNKRDPKKAFEKRGWIP